MMIIIYIFYISTLTVFKSRTKSSLKSIQSCTQPISQLLMFSFFGADDSGLAPVHDEVYELGQGQSHPHRKKNQGSWIREAIEIRKRGLNTFNQDEGAYILSQTWTNILEGASGQQKA